MATKTTSLEKFLKLGKPEEYDLKDEKNYDGETNLDKMLAYKSIKDGFDCDGSGTGNEEKLCKLIRYIYRNIWSWNDIYKEKDNINYVLRYALSPIYCRSLYLGPEP